MQTSFVFSSIAVVLLALAIQPSHQKTECEKKRDDAEKLVKQQERGQSLNLAIVVPNCNEDGSYATLQCHHNSSFCQCWDKDGSPLTQPKKNLKKCTCMVDRAKEMKKMERNPSTAGDLSDLTSCELDGSYTPKQCDRSACWCVNPETGKKLGTESKDKSSVRC